MSPVAPSHGQRSFTSTFTSRAQRMPAVSMAFVTRFEQLAVKTGRTVSLVDITSEVVEVVEKSGCKEGTVTVLAKHSTVGVMLNEFEERFVSDARQWLLRLAPPSDPWLHNDIDFRCRLSLARWFALITCTLQLLRVSTLACPLAGQDRPTTQEGMTRGGR